MYMHIYIYITIWVMWLFHDISPERPQPLFVNERHCAANSHSPLSVLGCLCEKSIPARQSFPPRFRHLGLPPFTPGFHLPAAFDARQAARSAFVRKAAHMHTNLQEVQKTFLEVCVHVGCFPWEP
jgi:hypothetical protein